MLYNTMSQPVLEAFHVLKQDPNIQILQRAPLSALSENAFPLFLRDEMVGDEIDLIILDTETTGLNANEHEMIELGLVKLSYSPSIEQITKIQGRLSLLEQPKTPITEELTKVHGITNEMVEGHTFPDEKIHAIFHDVALVIAHNAPFDRGFFDKRFPELSNLPWACTIKDVDWQSFGLEGSKLLYLLYQVGYFYDAHRADIDCLAVTQLLLAKPEALPALIESARKVQARINCWFAPYHVKDQLKERGYYWDSKRKSEARWVGTVDKDKLDEEFAWLNGVCKTDRFQVEEITAYQRYK